MEIDAHGLRVTGATPDASADFDQALGEFNLYRGDPVATIDRALAAAPKFVMAHILKAYLFAFATEPAAAAEARTIVAAARQLSMDEREGSARDALARVRGGGG